MLSCPYALLSMSDTFLETRRRSKNDIRINVWLLQLAYEISNGRFIQGPNELVDLLAISECYDCRQRPHLADSMYENTFQFIRVSRCAPDIFLLTRTLRPCLSSPNRANGHYQFSQSYRRSAFRAKAKSSCKGCTT